MAALIWTVVGLVAIFFVSYFYRLFKNYHVAKSFGLPIFVLPVDSDNPFVLLLNQQIINLASRIPFGNGTFTRFGVTDWTAIEKGRVVTEFGDGLVIVSPEYNWIYINSPETAADVLHRRQDFDRPIGALAVLGVFGPNVSTTHGPVWARQRKATATVFNDQANNAVWDATIGQATAMLRYWKNQGATHTMAHDIRTLTLNILLAAGFGKTLPFQGHAESTEKVEDSGPHNHRDALGLILSNAMLVLALGPKLLQNLPLTKKMRRLGRATSLYQQYLGEELEKEKKLAARGESGDGPLLASLVRLGGKDRSQEGLKDDEIFGNMFVFQFAGHDTTAHTLAFALMYLAAYPEVQEWMQEELDHVLPSDQPESWSYREHFPRLKRTVAVLFETLRVAFPLLSLMKSPNNHATTIQLNGKSVHVPAKTRLILNVNGLNHHPKYWPHSNEADLNAWNPSRLIQTTDSQGSVLDREAVVFPPKASFLPFSDGPRVCPGRKVAQTEHVAVMATLFRTHRLKPVPETGEDDAAARERAKAAIADSGMVLLYQMRHPERVAFRWEKRS